MRRRRRAVTRQRDLGAGNMEGLETFVHLHTEMIQRLLTIGNVFAFISTDI